MATAREHMAADIAAVLADTGEAAELVFYNGMGVNAIVAVDDTAAVETRSKKMADTARIHVLVEDIPDPQYRDEVIIAGRTWNVVRVQFTTPYLHCLQLETNRRRTP